MYIYLLKARMRLIYQFSLVLIYVCTLSCNLLCAQKVDTASVQKIPPPPPRASLSLVCFPQPYLLPLFPGCANIAGDRDVKLECSTEKITAYVNDNLQYPEEAKSAGIQGRVVVQFNVETNGMISDVRCVWDIGYGCGAEAMRIVESMNQMNEKWTPGKQRGKPVRVQFTLPVSFKL